MTAKPNPTIRRRRLGAELRQLRIASGLKSKEAAERLMVSQPKISHLENGNRAASPRDVRALCAIYGVTDQQVIDSLMELARESGQRGWWHPYGDLTDSAYIGLETDATSLHTYTPLIPELLQTPAYAQVVIEESVPMPTSEQAAARLKVRLRRQHRIYDLTRPLHLQIVLDEAALYRVIGSPDVMREQLEHLNALSAEPHITLQVLPYTAGAHPGLSGQFSILQFTDSPQPGVVHLERFTHDLFNGGVKYRNGRNSRDQSVRLVAKGQQRPRERGVAAACAYLAREGTLTCGGQAHIEHVVALFATFFDSVSYRPCLPCTAAADRAGLSGVGAAGAGGGGARSGRHGGGRSRCRRAADQGDGGGSSVPVARHRRRLRPAGSRPRPGAACPW
ncbi:helix-turn-helix domain-containing protein [Streptomyces atroolivaceus]|uniref:helix-turn-helix domain-containing protein n=1 Tax=Streptomyces atroolivaceus TaxID=66869 RepID=UPI0037BBB441